MDDEDDCELVVPWFEVDVEPVSLEVWFAFTELFVLLLPLPTFTPGLTLALAFRSVLLTFALASTLTFGFTLSVRPLAVLPDCVPAVPEAEPVAVPPAAPLFEDVPSVLPLTVPAAAGAVAVVPLVVAEPGLAYTVELDEELVVPTAPPEE